MHKIGVIGDKDSVLCFKAFGFEVFPAILSKPEENRKAVDRMARDGFGIIFVTEQIAETITETIDRYNKDIKPAIILIPGNKGSLGIGMNRIRKNMERAVGMNILD
jgi:V/A-type H+-transporting ATPase subunit F